MRLKKPIKKFTLEELHEAQESLQGLIQATQLIKDNLGDSSDPLTALLDFHLKMTILPDASMLNFRDLTDHNLNSFKMAYEIVMEELGKRETYVD